MLYNIKVPIKELNMTKEQIKTELATVKAEIKRLALIGLRDGSKARILEQWERHWRSELAK